MVPLGFSVCVPGMMETAIIVGLIFLLLILRNLWILHLSRPVDLLHSGNVGETEPRSRKLMALIGLVALLTGYVMAVTIQNPITALSTFFIAVILVIIGTYCLFTAGSIALLKLLRKNKRYYYQTGHFIGVSGMLYRMKRNAVGLANICILSTMVMVRISGTLSLYLGTGEIINAQYPADFQIEVRYGENQEESFDPQAAVSLAEGFAKNQGLAVEDLRTVEYVSMNVSRDEYGGFLLATSSDRSLNRMAYLITAADYAALSGQTAPELAPGQAMVCGREVQPAV